LPTNDALLYASAAGLVAIIKVLMPTYIDIKPPKKNASTGNVKLIFFVVLVLSIGSIYAIEYDAYIKDRPIPMNINDDIIF
jgi:hypothetical protein